MHDTEQSSSTLTITCSSSPRHKTKVILFVACVVVGSIIALVAYQPPYLAVLISLIIAAALFLNPQQTPVYIIDKAADCILVVKGSEQTYVSDYPLTQIKCIKTRIAYKYLSPGDHTYVSLIVVLKNGDEKVLDTQYGVGSISTVENHEVTIGTKLAEFLSVPFIKGDYEWPLI